MSRQRCIQRALPLVVCIGTTCGPHRFDEKLEHFRGASRATEGLSKGGSCRCRGSVMAWVRRRRLKVPKPTVEQFKMTFLTAFSPATPISTPQQCNEISCSHHQLTFVYIDQKSTQISS